MNEDRRGEEYRADVWLTARRVLDEWHWRLFRLHFLKGWQWWACCRVLRVSRGNFFHGCYRVQEWVGRALREVRPYAVFPPRGYFTGGRHESTTIGS